MKSLMIATASVAAALAAAPSLTQAQDLSGFNNLSGYGSLSYGYLDGRGVDLSAITGRLGVRMGRFLGVEGDLSGGLNSDSFNSAGTTVSTRLRDQYAGYVVGFLPVTANFDLLARVGAGETELKASAPGTINSGSMASFNYGVGAQYMFDPHNGLRADYTRYSYWRDGGDTNAWTIGYIRKF